jgi:hypothetical protein
MMVFAEPAIIRSTARDRGTFALGMVAILKSVAIGRPS